MKHVLLFAGLLLAGTAISQTDKKVTLEGQMGLKGLHYRASTGAVFPARCVHGDFGHVDCLEYIKWGEHGFVRRVFNVFQYYDASMKLVWQKQQDLFGPKKFTFFTKMVAGKDHLYYVQFHKNGLGPNEYLSVAVFAKDGTIRTKTDVKIPFICKADRLIASPAGLVVVGNDKRKGEKLIQMVVISKSDLSVTIPELKHPYQEEPEKISSYASKIADFYPDYCDWNTGDIWLKKSYVYNGGKKNAVIVSQYVVVDEKCNLKKNFEVEFPQGYAGYADISTYMRQGFEGPLIFVMQQQKKLRYIDVFQADKNGKAISKGNFKSDKVTSVGSEGTRSIAGLDLMDGIFRDHLRGTYVANTGFTIFEFTDDFELLGIYKNDRTTTSGMKGTSLSSLSGGFVGGLKVLDANDIKNRSSVLNVFANEGRKGDFKNYWYHVFSFPNKVVVVKDDSSLKKTFAFVTEK